MKATLNIDNELLQKAAELTGVEAKTSLVRMGLQALISQEAAKRLAALGASSPNLSALPRRRSIRKAGRGLTNEIM